LINGKPLASTTTSGSKTAPQPAPQPANQPGAAPRPGQPPPARPVIDGLQISGLYLANPPNDKEARIIDEFVDQLQKSAVFKIEEKDKAKAVIQRTTPDGQSWAYGYTIVLPLRNPISVP
jgi:hypothetical protein